MTDKADSQKPDCDGPWKVWKEEGLMVSEGLMWLIMISQLNENATKSYEIIASPEVQILKRVQEKCSIDKWALNDTLLY